MLQIVFNTVFESLLGATPRPLTLPQFSIEQLARQSEGLHADDVASPSKLRFQDHGFNAAARLALSTTSRLVTLSCHLMPMIDRKALIWKRSSCLMCFL